MDIQNVKETIRIKASVSSDQETINAKIKDTSSNVGIAFNEAVVISNSGSTDYNNFTHKPSIQGIELKGNKTFEQLGLQTLDNSELESLLV